MTEKTIKYVYSIRSAIYIALFVSLIIKAIILLPPINAAEENIPSKYEFFWPPDMVPHPVVPEPDGPNKEGDLA